MSLSFEPLQTSHSFPWVPDQLNGLYRNPILCADYPDPDVVRDGRDYFMTVSSFHVAPGLPILHSRDLVNWTLINHALPRLPSRYDAAFPGCGVWAPAIRKHAGKFWIFFPMPDEGIFCTVADHPAATWSEPRLVQAGRGLIDPCPLWDDDGRAYLVHAYAFSRSGIKHKLRVCPMAPDGSRLLGEGHIVFDDPENHPTLEGPKFLKAHGCYYILAPAGGVETGWQLALRSRTVFGPYEPKVILEQGSTTINGPHQGALIDTPSGDWWFVHFQEARPYGRIVHLQPAHWKDGWPLLGIDQDGNGIGEPILELPKPLFHVPASQDPDPAGSRHCEPQTSDDFHAPIGEKLGHQWHWNANPWNCWYSLSARPGWLRLFAHRSSCRLSMPPGTPADSSHKDLIHLPHILMQKFPARSFAVETKIDFHPADSRQRAGIAIIGREYAALVLRPHRSVSHSAQLVLECIVNGTVVAQAEVPRHTMRLRIHVTDGGLCSFGYEHSQEKRESFPHEFQAVAGVWVGAKVGLFAMHEGSIDDPVEVSANRGYADFDYLHFAPPTAFDDA
jgi:beta-xylosidase